MDARPGKAANPDDLLCEFDDDQCDGCSLKLAGAGKRGPDGKLSDFEALHLAAKLHQAAKANDVPKLEKMLAEGADINAVNEDKATALWLAAQNNNLACLEVLFAQKENGTAKINATNKFDYTPVYIAAKQNHPDALKALIEKKADINAKDFQHFSPVYIAAKHNNVDTLRELMEAGADLNAADKQLESPIFVAAQQNNREALKQLLAEGDVCGACAIGTYVLVKGFPVCSLCSMGKRGGALINAANIKGQTPVYTAAKHQSLHTLKMLIAAGADIDAADEAGKSPLWAAADQGNTEAVHVLVEAGSVLDAADKLRRSPLYAAAAADRVECLEVITMMTYCNTKQYTRQFK